MASGVRLSWSTRYCMWRSSCHCHWVVVSGHGGRWRMAIKKSVNLPIQRIIAEKVSGQHVRSFVQNFAISFIWRWWWSTTSPPPSPPPGPPSRSSSGGRNQLALTKENWGCLHKHIPVRMKIIILTLRRTTPKNPTNRCCCLLSGHTHPHFFVRPHTLSAHSLAGRARQCLCH